MLFGLNGIVATNFLTFINHNNTVFFLIISHGNLLTLCIGTSNRMVGQIIIDPHMIKEKITSVLKVLKFREQRVLVQFWSPIVLGKQRWVLMNCFLPFGIGVADEELYTYRLSSELRPVVGVKEHSEISSAPGLAYMQKLVKWGWGVHGQDTRYNFHGYINIPILEPSSDSCIGVLEMITSSSYVDFPFEVQEILRALKELDMKFPNVFDDPRFNVFFQSIPFQVKVPPPESENKENELPSDPTARGESQSVVPYLKNMIGGFDIDSGKRTRKRTSEITFEEIRKQFGKTLEEAAKELNVSRSTLKRCCRNLGLQSWPPRNGQGKGNADTLMNSDVTKLNVSRSPLKPIFRDLDKIDADTLMNSDENQLNVSRSTLKRYCWECGIQSWPRIKGPGKSIADTLMNSDENQLNVSRSPLKPIFRDIDKIDADTLMKSNETDIASQISEGALTQVYGDFNEPFGDTTYITHDPVVLTAGSSELPPEQSMNTISFAQQTPTNQPAFDDIDFEWFNGPLEKK